MCTNKNLSKAFANLFWSGCLILMTSGLAKAEYNQWNYTLTITTVDGNSIKGYGMTYDWMPEDSVSSSDYLWRHLIFDADSFAYYTHQFVYQNRSDSAAMYDPEYLLFNRKMIATNQIQHLRLTEMAMTSTLSGIANEESLSMEDTAWMTQPLVASTNFFCGSCDYSILIHEAHPELDQMIREIKELIRTEEDLEDPMNVGLNNAIHEMIQQKKSFKFVVISVCTC